MICYYYIRRLTHKHQQLHDKNKQRQRSYPFSVFFCFFCVVSSILQSFCIVQHTAWQCAFLIFFYKHSHIFSFTQKQHPHSQIWIRKYKRKKEKKIHKLSFCLNSFFNFLFEKVNCNPPLIGNKLIERIVIYLKVFVLTWWDIVSTPQLKLFLVVVDYFRLAWSISMSRVCVGAQPLRCLK